MAVDGDGVQKSGREEVLTESGRTEELKKREKSRKRTAKLFMFDFMLPQTHHNSSPASLKEDTPLPTRKSTSVVWEEMQRPLNFFN